jgi:hypothetical protein
MSFSSSTIETPISMANFRSLVLKSDILLCNECYNGLKY